MLFLIVFVSNIGPNIRIKSNYGIEYESGKIDGKIGL